MSTIAPFGLISPLISAPWSPPAQAHAMLLIVQIFGERRLGCFRVECRRSVRRAGRPDGVPRARVGSLVCRGSRPRPALAAINAFLWSVNFFYVLLYANVLPLIFATRPVRPSRDNFCGELRPRRRRRLSARLMRITSGEPVPTERLATYDDTRQIFAD